MCMSRLRPISLSAAEMGAILTLLVLGVKYNLGSESLFAFLTTSNPLLPETTLIGFRAVGSLPNCSHGCPAGPLLALGQTCGAFSPTDPPGGYTGH